MRRVVIVVFVLMSLFLMTTAAVAENRPILTSMSDKR